MTWINVRMFFNQKKGDINNMNCCFLLILFDRRAGEIIINTVIKRFLWINFSREMYINKIHHAL